MPVSLSNLQSALPPGGLFGSAGWKWSPEPLKLSGQEVKEIEAMAFPLVKFQQACDSLYRRSAAGREHPWLAELLDQGKPSCLTDFQKKGSSAKQFPRVIRPDLIRLKKGFAVTELDSVPGGMGITAWLSAVYSKAGYEVLGGSDGMVEGFRSLLPHGGDILISDEAGDYRAEMNWLAQQLGADWKTERAENYEVSDRAMYRFFELFDHAAIPSFRSIAEKAATGEIEITPPLKPHLEEKAWLSLFWTPSLKKVWEKEMRANHLKRLRELIPYGWILDPESLPAHAALPKLNVHSWEEVGSFSQKERELVLKISGFHETAWGSRGVFIGHDLSTVEWRKKLQEALNASSQQTWVMQEFHEGQRFEHPIYDDKGDVRMIEVRARLCPYFFVSPEQEVRLGGCLATLVPADKKKIHGMSEGILVPCILSREEN